MLDRKNIFLLGATLLLLAGVTEFFLRANPLLLGDKYATKVLEKYHTGYDGMYEYDPVVNMLFMKPNFETIAYWNRYAWTHKTDKWGFRNPTDRDSAEIVLLGDSLIYGHGVDQNQTVGYFLENITDLSVMNMGRQGDSTYQEVYKLNKYGLGFRPRYVFYFFYNNDIPDLNIFLPQDEMKQFIETPIADITFKDRPKRNSASYPRLESFMHSLRKSLYFTRQAIKYGGHTFKDYIKKMIAKSVGNSRKSLAKASKSTQQEGVDSIKWKYTQKAILQMKHVSNANHADFVIVPILFGNTQYFRILENIATENNISFIDARAIDHVESYRLPRDGHFSGKGALAMAEIVGKYISEREEKGPRHSGN